jgi:hypothetical protein
VVFKIERHLTACGFPILFETTSESSLDSCTQSLGIVPVDPISVATTAISLFSTCYKCYNFFIELKAAPKSKRNAVIKLKLELWELLAWGKYWAVVPRTLQTW